MQFAVYRTTDGKIGRIVTCPEDHVSLQLKEGEEHYPHCPPEATHIIDGAPVTLAKTPNPDPSMAVIRATRAALLTACDWTQVSDSPLDAATRQKWATYRQALRDFPKTCDTLNPQWPTHP